MEIIEENKSAYTKFDVSQGNVIDKFESNGKICLIRLKEKNSAIRHKIKMTIGETVLTQNELIDPFQGGEIPIFVSLSNPCNRVGKSFIEFKQGDIFKFEQLSESINEVSIWFCELEMN